MPLYTRRGDLGSTSVYRGRELPKDAPLMEAIGTVDELSSHLGLLAAHLGTPQVEALQRAQRHLFNVGASLAEVPHVPLPGPEDVQQLEIAIDQLETRLGNRTFAFVLPGGSVAAAQAHVARTVCRRAERRLVAAARLDLVPYLNRLSDWLYALALTL